MSQIRNFGLKKRFESFEVRNLVIVSDLEIRVSDFQCHCRRLTHVIPCVQQPRLWVGSVLRMGETEGRLFSLLSSW